MKQQAVTSAQSMPSLIVSQNCLKLSLSEGGTVLWSVPEHNVADPLGDVPSAGHEPQPDLNAVQHICTGQGGTQAQCTVSMAM